jgi:hypothetical protein
MISFFPNGGLPSYYWDIGYWQSALARLVRERAHAGTATLIDRAGTPTVRDIAGTPALMDRAGPATVVPV